MFSLISGSTTRASFVWPVSVRTWLLVRHGYLSMFDMHGYILFSTGRRCRNQYRLPSLKGSPSYLACLILCQQFIPCRDSSCCPIFHNNGQKYLCPFDHPKTSRSSLLHFSQRCQ